MSGLNSRLVVKGIQSKQMKFKDDPKTMVITTKRIINKDTDILTVSHDEEDGMWQFLDGYENDENNAAIISLQEITAIDHSIEVIADLPLGWTAWRPDINSAWNRKKQ